MLIVGENVAATVISMSQAIEMMEQVFLEYYRGEAEIYPVVAGRAPDGKSRFGVKSGLMGKRRLVGLKVGSYWPDNRTAGIPAHASTTVLLDPETGYPHALVAASHLTCVRTAASDGVAIKHLSRPDSSSVALIGAGHQAWYELLAAMEVRPIETVRIWNRSISHAQDLATRITTELGLAAYACSAEEAVAAADIVITITSAGEPLVRREWVAAGTHISAMGSDTVGKFELDPELVASGRLFADVVAQSITLGDFESAFLAGKIQLEAISPIGSVIAGERGRRSSEEITIYDSSGMALQDLAVADLTLKNALAQGLVSDFPFLAHDEVLAR